MSDLVVTTDAGLYCPAGGFYIDPWQPVERAIVTHAHADHARPGSQHYLCAADGVHVLRTRLGPDAAIETVGYGQTLSYDGVTVSLHPAGHVLGSAQVRIEHRGEVWVVSGDYKVAADRTCAGFEPLRCHAFITESTFGLPIYRWPHEDAVWGEINRWWRSNVGAGQCSLVYAYALGKAQRLLSGLDASIGPIYCHGAVERLNADYRTSAIALPPTEYVGDVTDPKKFRTALVVAPPSARGTPWLRRFGDFASGFASGWMQLRGARRRRNVERGFVLSDHADWPGLTAAIAATGAERVLVTHGATGPMVRWLSEQGLRAEAIATPMRPGRSISSAGENPSDSCWPAIWRAGAPKKPTCPTGFSMNAMTP